MLVELIGWSSTSRRRRSWFERGDEHGRRVARVTNLTPPAGARILDVLPIACSLSAAEGKAQLDKWRAFDEAHLIATEELPGAYVATYTRDADTERTLRALVATESSCCSFADWSVEASGTDLQLIVRGSPDALAALSIR